MEPYDLDGATGIELELTLQEDPYDQTFAYGINHVPSWKAKPILASLGETQVWTVTNSTASSYPLQPHGFFFMVLDAAGDPVPRSSGRTRSLRVVAHRLLVRDVATVRRQVPEVRLRQGERSGEPSSGRHDVELRMQRKHPVPTRLEEDLSVRRPALDHDRRKPAVPGLQNRCASASLTMTTPFEKPPRREGTGDTLG